jgi:hypothetical protein
MDRSTPLLDPGLGPRIGARNQALPGPQDSRRRPRGRNGSEVAAGEPVRSLLLLAILAASFLGCFSRLVRLGPETYMASKRDYLFGTTEGMVADAVENANTFCSKQGKVALVSARRSIWAEGHGRAEVIFQCADVYRFRMQ